MHSTSPKLLLPLPGRAAPCDSQGYGLPTGPVAAGLLEGELGRAHRTCGRSELAVDAGGLLVVDLDNFYGRLAAGLRLEGSWAWGPRGELFGSLEVLRYDSLITPLSSSSLGLGHATVGAGTHWYNLVVIGAPPENSSTGPLVPIVR